MKAIELNQFWECPKCGSQASMGPPAQMHPPKCSWGHETAEMEQVSASRFGRAFDAEGTAE